MREETIIVLSCLCVCTQFFFLFFRLFLFLLSILFFFFILLFVNVRVLCDMPVHWTFTLIPLDDCLFLIFFTLFVFLCFQWVLLVFSSSVTQQASKSATHTHSHRTFLPLALTCSPLSL